MLRKITELYEDKSLTRYEVNALGERERVNSLLRYPRQVVVQSAGKRFAHLVIDASIYIFVIPFALKWIFGDWTMDLWYLLSFSLFCFLFEYAFQQTPGKMLLGSVVINEYGNKPDLFATIFRSAVRTVPFEWFSFLYRDRGWHDKWTNTYVVSRAELRTLKSLMEDEKNFIADTSE